MKKAIPFGFLLVPTLAFAQFGSTPRDFPGLVYFFISIINSVVPLLIGVAIIIFFWGIFQYIWSGEEGDKEKGRELMVWGTIAFFVMVSVFGLVRILVNTFT